MPFHSVASVRFLVSRIQTGRLNTGLRWLAVRSDWWYGFSSTCANLIALPVSRRLQLLLQRKPLLQTGGQQLEDCQVGWNHKGLARLLSVDKMLRNWLNFLNWQLASKGHCFRIAHYLRLPQCTASCKFLSRQLCTFLRKMCAFQPVQPELQLCRKAPRDLIHRLNKGCWMFST